MKKERKTETITLITKTGFGKLDVRIPKQKAIAFWEEYKEPQPRGVWTLMYNDLQRARCGQETLYFSAYQVERARTKLNYLPIHDYWNTAVKKYIAK